VKMMLFVTIALGKEKYQTSVKEKSLQDVEWHEECDLTIPKHGNVAEIVLTALHRNFIGVDEFLGVVNIPLADLDVYEKPRNRWYKLQSKPGKQKSKARGELEVMISFHVKAGSLTDLSKSKKHRSSLGQLTHMAQSVGGSLLSIGSLENNKGISKLTASLGSKRVTASCGLPENGRSDREGPSQIYEDADPGVRSDVESIDDFKLDELSHRSSGSSFSTVHHGVESESMAGRKSGSQFKSSYTSLDKRDKVRQNITTTEREKPKGNSLLVRKFQQFRRESRLFDMSSDRKTNVPEERVIIGGEASKLSPEILQQYVGKSKE
ncbi:hypothetical protein L9F63_017166, partial [Diploptera punctata]